MTKFLDKLGDRWILISIGKLLDSDFYWSKILQKEKKQDSFQFLDYASQEKAKGKALLGEQSFGTSERVSFNVKLVGHRLVFD